MVLFKDIVSHNLSYTLFTWLQLKVLAKDDSYIICILIIAFYQNYVILELKISGFLGNTYIIYFTRINR